MAETPAAANIGFLTVLQEPTGKLGGYLVTNSWGRPLEFRLSTAVQPGRVHQILYGPTLENYICGDLIGKTLFDKTATPVGVVLTDCPAALDLRLKVEVPVVWLARPDDSAVNTGAVQVLAAVEGRGPLLCHGRFAQDATFVRSLLERLDEALDITEPFGRIREAITEAHDGDDEQELTMEPLKSEPEPVRPEVQSIELALLVEAHGLPRFERPLQVSVREAKLLNAAPWVRSLGKLTLDVATEGWKFPAPVLEAPPPKKPRLMEMPSAPPDPAKKLPTRLKPSADTVLFKERLLYLLQPSLESLFAGRQVQLPFAPFPYQLEGIAFLMPRHAALLADEMGLGKTIQAIVALRLLFHAGLIRRALVVCPKPLVPNWSRELKLWADDVPFETVGGDTRARRAAWTVSNCPLKLVNYEVLTRDADIVNDAKVRFDVVVLDEAQRIKNRDAKTAQVVRAIHRDRSWALTGTPVENRSEDLINIFAFVDADRVPPDTPAKRLPHLTGDCILRRTTDQVLTDLPAKIIRDAYLELTPAQRDSYILAEKEGVIRLNEMGRTITVQHVFELVMRLKQICNFDPATGDSAKLEQLRADLAEVAESGRKAIIFSQWVEPLEVLAKELRPLGPLQYHGRIPSAERQVVLEQFRKDRRKHVLLMSYGTGSVGGLNLQFANYVFLFDRWWNPAVEDQAIKRAHRIGQKDRVFVTRFVMQDTIEGKIAAVLEKKRQLFSDLLEQNGPPPQMGLTQDEIFGLFDIQARPTTKAA